jgi:mRNA-degrading endonuclease RelE of RelBE toxin-antitoxin system
MNIIFIETPEFIHKIDVFASKDEFYQIQDELLDNPTKGKIIKGCGGARKIRMKLTGTGKSGGARIIYYYVDLKGEIWFLDLYMKKVKEDLTENEKKRLFRFIKEVINE